MVEEGSQTWRCQVLDKDLQCWQIAGVASFQSSPADLHELMAQVAAGQISPDSAANQVVRQIEEDVGSPAGQNGTAAEHLFQQLSASSGAHSTSAQKASSKTANGMLEVIPQAKLSTSLTLPKSLAAMLGARHLSLMPV